MMKAVYKTEGAQLSIDILSSPQVREFIESHSSVLDSSFEKVEMSDAMRKRLQRSDFIFSGMKTFHELNEAFPSMLDENGERKPFERFLNDVRSIDKTYNSNYLRAEYNFVTASAEMAAKWEEFEQDGDRYNLQYRTQKDDKVRPEHAALDGVTLPPSDSFWSEFYPPNGWNCRCTVVQVRKSKYPASDHDEAMTLGDVALQKDSKGMFHFNAGIEQKTVPDYNPYTIRRCRECDIAKGKRKLARETLPDNQVCASWRYIHSLEKKSDNEVSLRKKVREAQKSLVEWYKGNLPTMKVGKFDAKRFEITTNDNKNVFINKKFYEETKNKYQKDPLYSLKLEYAKKAHDLLSEASFIRPEESRDHPGERFEVYEYLDTCFRIEMKIRCNTDGNYLHVLRIYPK
ncbi:MAG: phage head morphogenesis protein [Muribaculaceae bacterium]|nr:phage head morphogenesis protein [Muribaculaceae bacterium]